MKLRNICRGTALIATFSSIVISGSFISTGALAEEIIPNAETEADDNKEKKEYTDIPTDEKLTDEGYAYEQKKDFSKESDTKATDSVQDSNKVNGVMLKKQEPAQNVSVKPETIKDGWIFENNSWYFYSSGNYYTGWHYMDAAEKERTPHWSYFGEDGKLYTGWRYMSSSEGEKVGHWSYFGKNGWLQTGWKYLTETDGEKIPHWSYFGEDGWLRTDWVYLDGDDGEKTPHWSYFGNNGWLREGWQKMGKGTSNPDSESDLHWSYFGNNGWLKTGWFKENQGINGLRYFDDAGWLAGGLGHKSDWQSIGRVDYLFDEKGQIKGVHMPLEKTYNQMSYYFLGACGPTAAFHASHATESLSDYNNSSFGYKSFVWDFYGMPYYTNDINSKGVYTTGSSIPQLSRYIRNMGVDTEISENRQYTTDEVKDALVHGQAVVPLIYFWYVGNSSSYWSQHYVAVTGWKMENGSLQFYTVDSYNDLNTGWTDVNKKDSKYSAYGYNGYTGYIDEIGTAAKPRTGKGYAMKIGEYIDIK